MTDPETARRIRTITERIARVTQAQALADAGKYEEAVALLRRVRDTYSDESMRAKVDWLIEDLARRGNLGS
ncbi:MAG: hypothetical protein D6731_09165 [Planctomycetota bacterium]|nr:MAG: hypothetical protein D6731_09165 [Planctomycetota bacterium]